MKDEPSWPSLSRNFKHDNGLCLNNFQNYFIELYGDVRSISGTLDGDFVLLTFCLNQPSHLVLFLLNFKCDLCDVI